MLAKLKDPAALLVLILIAVALWVATPGDADLAASRTLHAESGE